MHHRDAYGFETRYVEDAVTVEVINLAVGNEIEIGATNRARGGQHGERRAEFENRRLADASTIGTEFVRGAERGRDVKRAIVFGERNSVGIEKLPVQMQWGKCFACGIKTKYLVGKTVGRKNVPHFAHDEIIEAMLLGLLRRKPREHFSVRGDVQDLRSTGAGLFFPGVGPDSAIVRIHANSENGQEAFLLRLQKIAWIRT